MSNDIERLLATAADDADQPLHTDVEDILVRARRSVRRGRIATAATGLLTTAVIVGGIAVWSSTRSDSVEPAGQTITIDPKTGRIIDGETGKTVTPAPPVSPLSDAVILSRCKQDDLHYIAAMERNKGNTFDKAGPIDASWKVMVKSGDQSQLSAMFLAPDKSIVATCTLDAAKNPQTYGRVSTITVIPGSPHNQPQAVENGLRVPTPGVTRVLVDVAGEKSPREALVGIDGFFTLGYTEANKDITVSRIRGYDATGKKLYEQVNTPVTPTFPSVDPSVTVKTVQPIAPVVVLTKDPVTGKPLAPAPPVSPLTDDQIRDRCTLWEREVNTNPVYGVKGKPQDPRATAAGPITSSWAVALKTGTGDKFTAVLVSPDQRVAVWCHMTKPVTKGGESDYTRHAVNADGKFADNFEFAMVPAGVAQMVIDLPAGPTRVLMANGFYTWGLTGGNSDIKTVKIRGYDAHGKKVYEATKQVDAD